MLKRDNRIVDIQIVRSLGAKRVFFASTSILVLAGLIAILGATERAIEFARSIPILSAGEPGILGSKDAEP